MVRELRLFGIVLTYELKEYFKNKLFMTLTLVFAVAGALLLFLPRFMDLSDITGIGGAVEQAIEGNAGSAEPDRMLLLDEAGYMDTAVLQEYFPDTEWIMAASVEEIKNAVETEEAAAGFVVQSSKEYDYYIFNKGLMDNQSRLFDEAMKFIYQREYFTAKGLDMAEVKAVYDAPITVNEQILNKDSGSSFWYCYTLVIVVFMLIVLYGQMIAVSVTNEKSTRAIEVLVTSTTPNSLLFGKVIAGAIGGLFQVGAILGAVLLSYQINRSYWGGMLDMIFKIPGDVLLIFALFGTGGYLFYAFLYGAMGALVSKTEDINKNSSGLIMIITAVYIFSLAQLSNMDGIIIKILSFLPISSYSTMFARIAMGTVSGWEVAVSFLILVVSVIGTGMLGAGLYRLGTLRYGNPIKLRTALKDLKGSKRKGVS